MNAPTALPVATGSQVWHEVRRLARGHRVAVAAVLALGLVSAALALVTPAVIGRLVDQIVNGNADTAMVLLAAAVVAGAALLGAAGTAATVVLAARVYNTMLADLREQLITQTMRLPQDVVERSGTGDLVARASDDVAEIAKAAPQVIPAFTSAGFTIVVTFAAMSALDWRYTLALALVVPIYLLILRWYLTTAPAIYAAERAAMGHRAQHILESVNARDTITGFGLNEQRHHRVIGASWAVAGHSQRTRTVANMFLSRLHTSQYVGLTAILVTGYVLIDSGHSTLGAATTATLFFLRLFGPINQLLFVIDIVQSMLSSLARIIGVTSTPAPEAADDPSQSTSLAGAHSEVAVEVNDLTFAYASADRPVLDRVSLRIAPGQRTAIVGTSGAGKTTLARVLAGIHTPETGMVTRPARTVMISQEAHVFAGTLRENLTLAAPDATDTDLHAALKATGADRLLDLLPHGLDTPIGAAGQHLTAAQAQHLALTRLVLADPDLAILDEATAEAGSTHAEQLDQAANAALTGRTGLVIAHRLSQAATCDQIAVMDHGRIIEHGTHHDLLRAGGTYARLWEAWSGGQQHASAGR